MSSAQGAYRNPPRLERVTWHDLRAVAMRAAMDAETGAMYADYEHGLTPSEHAALVDALSIDPATISHTVVALDGDEPIGHAALRPVSDGVSTSSTTGVSTGSTTGALEVKKVFVAEGARGRAVGRLLMAELESIARAQGAASLVLQTGPLQVAAIGLYLGLGYVPIPPYGKYAAISNALCYELTL